jgi:hypothetical protein
MVGQMGAQTGYKKTPALARIMLKLAFVVYNGNKHHLDPLPSSE